MDSMYYIYKVTNIINNKVYIGRHLVRSKVYEAESDSYYGSGVYIKRALKKYGKINFKKEVLEYLETREDADVRERYWIQYYNSTDSDIGYNLSKGGTGFDAESSQYARSRMTDEQKHLRAEKTKQTYQDPTIRNRVSEKSKRQWAEKSVEQREEITRKMKEYWKSGGSDKRREYFRKLKQNPEAYSQYINNVKKGILEAKERNPELRFLREKISQRTAAQRSETLLKLYAECPLYKKLNTECNYPKSQLAKKVKSGELTQEEADLERVRLNLHRDALMIEIKQWRKDHNI